MACSTCSTAKPVPVCTNNLVLGTIPYINTNVYVFVRNNTTFRTHRIDAQSDSNGLVTLDLSQPSAGFYSESFTYDMWITERTYGSNEMVDFDIDGTDYECVKVPFDNIRKSSGFTSYDTITLEIDA